MKAQINMVFTFIVALLVIGAIVLIAVNMLGGTLQDKCSADVVVFTDSFRTAVRNNNDYGSNQQETFLAPCDYTTLCLVDARTLTNSTINGNFRDVATNFPGEAFIKDSVVFYGDESLNAQTNIFLIDNEGMVLDGGYSPQLSLANPANVTCITASQGRFTVIFRGQGRTTLIDTT